MLKMTCLCDLRYRIWVFLMGAYLTIAFFLSFHFLMKNKNASKRFIRRLCAHISYHSLALVSRMVAYPIDWLMIFCTFSVLAEWIPFIRIMFRSFKSASSHTIVLIQFNLERSRSYYDYETLSEALNGICSLYEARLKFKNPNKPNITYSIAELFEWMDKMTDISCLVYVSCHACKPNYYYYY